MLAKKLTDLPIVSISIISAIFHGIGQIIVVVYIYQSILMASFIILLFVTSIPTGIFTGLSAIAVIKHLKKYTVKLK